LILDFLFAQLNPFVPKLAFNYLSCFEELVRLKYKGLEWKGWG
jgi:hypothetical protein